MRKIELLSVFVLLTLFWGASQSVAMADGPPPGAVVHRVQVRPLGNRVYPLTLYRSGWTDGWYDWIPPYWYHVGSHTSDSDLVEDQIWVDGFSKREGASGWYDHCPDHTEGTTAHCNTSFKYYVPYDFYAESHHFFHKEGYQDDYFETGKHVS